MREKHDNSKYWLSDYMIGLQYLVYAEDKFIRSVSHYLIQSNSY